ncbi:MAG TPA: DJ-1 family glyoxalase III [Polyangiaceae bacterium]|nr:DJ-1 family glyoxalase III [Polyangiaceae bacterium]
MNALVPLADGFEELEAVTIIDVLRRAGVEVTVAAVGKSPVTGSHAIAISADAELDAVRERAFDAVVLPGGPAAERLRDDERVKAMLRRLAAEGKLVAAVCAAPIALEAAGVLRGKRATAYPGNALPSASFVEQRVVVDGNVVTSRAPGTALEFALSVVEKLAGAHKRDEVARAMLVAS